jgi:ATP-binding cassette subfamily F protein 3
MSFRYGRNQIFDALNLAINRGEKVALVGDNGEGKTTLTRLIHGELDPQAGSVTLGQHVNIGYYAQHQVEALNLDNTVLDEVRETAADSFRAKLRDILGVFRFHGDDVNKKIAVLSGGEIARVSLAKILLSPCNFLIMDEPTNHLDLKSKEALEHALRAYDGTLLVIAHDRYFLDRLVKRVIEIKKGHLYDYPGNYSYYLEKRKQNLNLVESPPEEEKEKEDSPSNNTGRKSKEQKRREAEARMAVSRERNRLQRQIDDIEKKLDSYTKRKKELELLLADPDTYNDPKKGGELNKEYSKLEERLSRLEVEWENNHLRLEELLKTLEN